MGWRPGPTCWMILPAVRFAYTRGRPTGLTNLPGIRIQGMNGRGTSRRRAMAGPVRGLLLGLIVAGAGVLTGCSGYTPSARYIEQLDSPDRATQLAAIAALRERGPTVAEAVEPLLELMNATDDNQVRHAAAEAIVNIVEAEEFEQLLKEQTGLTRLALRAARDPN